MNQRMEKLAELRKVASSEGPLTGQELSSINTWLDSYRTKFGTEYVDTALAGIARQVYDSFVANNRDFSINSLNQSIKENIISYISYFLIGSTTEAGSFPMKLIRKGSGVNGNENQLQNLQLKLEEMIVNARATLPDPTKWNKAEKSSSRTSGGGSAKTQATTGPLTIKHPKFTKLQDVGGLYIYRVEDPNSEFSYLENKKGGKSGSFKRNEVSVEKWNMAVAVLNDDKKVRVISTPAPAAETTSVPGQAAPATTTAPTEPAPAAQGQGEVPVTNLVTNVATILSNVDAGHTYALKTAANERRMVRRMLREIDSMPAAMNISGVVNSSLALAKVIVGAGGVTNDSNLANTPPSTVANMSEKDIERTFAPELATIMRVVVRIYSKIKDNPNILSSYVALRAPSKSTTPTPPAAASGRSPYPYSFTGVSPTLGNEADDEATINKSSSLDPKIKKLAKLRRLKVRGQMESAIEPSAKFGRSRVS